MNECNRLRPTPAAACNQWALHGYATMAALRLVDSTRAARFNALTHGRPSRPGSKGYSAEELLIAFSLARGRSLLRCTQRPPLPPEGWGSSSLRLCWYSHSFFPFDLHAMCAYPAGRPVCWWRCLQANSVGEGNTGTLTHARTHPHTHTCAVAWHGLPCAPFNGVSTVVCCCIMGSQLLSCARSRMTYAHTHTHSRATACAVGGRAAPTPTLTLTHSHTHTLTHTHTHTHTLTHSHSHTHTHTHISVIGRVGVTPIQAIGDMTHMWKT